MDDDELEMHIHDLTVWGEALNPRTPIERLVELSNHNSHHIRMFIMNNKTTPIIILEKLCWDEDPDVREEIHGNKWHPLEELKQAEEDLYFLL